MEKTAEKAQKMINDLLLAGFSGVKISEGSGINQLTISLLKNGKSKRITEKVYDRLWNFWDENLPPDDELQRLRTTSNATVQHATKDSTTVETQNQAAAPTKRKYARRTPVAASDATTLVNRNIVAIDKMALVSVLDSILSSFVEASNQLNDIRKMLR